MLVVLVVQLGNLALQVTEQAAVIQYFLPSPLLVVAVAVLVELLVLEKQAVLVAVAVTMVALAVLGIPHQHPRVKVTMVEHQMPPTMVVAVVVVRLP